MDVTFFVANIISGLANGSIYALLAISLVLIYRSNRLFNFALPQIATFMVICMFIFLRHMSYSAALTCILISSFGIGILLHLGVMRVITERKHVLHSSETVVTVGIYTIFNSLTIYFFGDEPEKFPTPFKESFVSLLGAEISSHSILTLAVCLIVSSILFYFFKYTRLGIILEATSESPIAARLRGINVSNILAFSWGITIVMGVIAAVLIAPVLFVSSSMLSSVFIYSLVAVALGGLESAFGALLGGLFLGVFENLISLVPFIGSDLKFVSVFVFLMIFLAIRPRGIWGREEQRRV